MVARRVLHIWSHLHCKWIVWRGTYTAWKLLPHAVVVGVACLDLGRRFIGIESDPNYFTIARQRIRSAYIQQRLFA